MNGYVIDRELREKFHEEGQNDWDSYLPELADAVGIRAVEIAAPVTGEKLKGLTYLMIGARNVEKEAEELKKWTEAGGILLLFGSTGTSRLTGFLREQVEKQTDDDFTTSAYISLEKEYAKRVYDHPEFKTLPVYSFCVETEVSDEAEVLAWLHRPTIFGLDGGDRTEYPAICKRKLGKGSVYYFAFSLPKTLWVLQQGRPVDRDYDGDGYYRTGDAIVLTRAHDLMIPYGDVYRSILKDILSEKPQPFIYELPVDEEGGIPDFILHYGGDDEGSKDYQMIASRVMKEKQIPYHVNLMLNGKGEFAITKEQYEELKQNGTTPAIHFDFFAARKFYTREEFDRQLDKYVETFGEVPKMAVNHVLMWTGWVDNERWCMERGIKADQTKIHKHLMPDYNPINTIGMAFGSTYPHFVYDDHAHGNAKMEFIDIPIGFFEPRVCPETEKEDKEQIDRALEMAFCHKATLNIFVHPIYLATEPACLAALDHIKEKIKEMGYRVMHVENDFLCDWWFDRSAIILEEIQRDETSFTFRAESGRPFVIQFKGSGDYFINGEKKRAQAVDRMGADWRVCALPAGENTVKIERNMI